MTYHSISNTIHISFTGRASKRLAIEVKKRVEYSSKNPKASVIDPSTFLVPYADDVLIKNGAVIPVVNMITRAIPGARGNYFIQIHLHNQSGRIIQTERLRYALLSRRDVLFGILESKGTFQRTSTDIRDNKRILDVPLTSQFLPGIP